MNKHKTAIPGVTSRIQIKDINPIAEKTLGSLFGDNVEIKYNLVGSGSSWLHALSSKISFEAFVGDIDVAVNMEDLLVSMGLLEPFIGNNKNQLWEYIDQWMKNNSPFEYKINKGFKQIHLLVPTNDENDKIQFDILLGNREWMKDILCGSPVTSKYKALYRNSLLVAMLPGSSYNEKCNSITRYNFDYREGIKKIIKNKQGETETIMFSKADQFVKWLFCDSNVCWNDVVSFESLLKLVKDNKWFGRKDIIISKFEYDLIRKHKSFIKEIYV